LGETVGDPLTNDAYNGGDHKVAKENKIGIPGRHGSLLFVLGF
jgi:hypothetical protein